MSISALTGGLGWKIQSAQGVPATGAFYWHKVSRMTAQPVELIQPFPQEIGGALLPAGMFKAGYWSQVAFECAPRLDANIGWLFLSFTGSGQVSGAGPYTHSFIGVREQLALSRWMTFRRLIPETDSTYFGEELQDTKVSGLTLTLDAASLAQMTIQASGLGVVPIATPSGVGWSPATDNGGVESYTGTPITACGAITMANGEKLLTVSSATIDFNSGSPPPREEMVVGSYVPHDISILQRAITVRQIMFWQNADLYNEIYNGGGTAWSPIPYAPDEVYEVWVETPGNLDGLGYKGRLGFRSAPGAMVWQMRPIDLRGGNIVVCELLGTVIDVPDVNGVIWYLYLINGRAAAYA